MTQELHPKATVIACRGSYMGSGLTLNAINTGLDMDTVHVGSPTSCDAALLLPSFRRGSDAVAVGSSFAGQAL